jgi:hypothetical protein
VVLRCVLANEVLQALRQLLGEVQGHRRYGFGNRLKMRLTDYVALVNFCRESSSRSSVK